MATIYTFENMFLSCALVSRCTFIPQLAKRGIGTSALEYERNSTQHRLFTTPPPPCAKHNAGTLPSTLPRLHNCNVRSFANLCSASSNSVDVTVRVKSSIVPTRERDGANILLVAQKKDYFVVLVPLHTILVCNARAKLPCASTTARRSRLVSPSVQHAAKAQ